MFYGWVVVIALWFGYLLAIGPEAYGFGVIIGPMTKDMGWTMAQATLGFSIYATLSGAVAPLAALAIKKKGIKLTMIAGTLIMGISELALARINTLWQYYVIICAIFPLGVTMGTVIPLQSAITNWFSRRRALALSLTLTSGGIGGLIIAPLTRYVIAGTGSFRSGWLMAAAGAFLASVVIAVLVRNSPEDMGLQPDGDSKSSFFDPAKPHLRVHQTKTNFSVADAMRTRAFWLITLTGCIWNLPVMVVLSQSVVYLSEKGFTEAAAATALGLVALFSTGGRLLAGVFGDRIEPSYLLTSALIFLGAGTFILLNAKEGLTLYMYVIVFGLGFGLAYISVSVMIGNYFGRENFPAINGVLFPIQTISGAVGTVIAAMVFDATGSYDLVFKVITILTFAGAVFAFFARAPLHPLDVGGNVQQPIN